MHIYIELSYTLIMQFSLLNRPVENNKNRISQTKMSLKIPQNRYIYNRSH